MNQKFQYKKNEKDLQNLSLQSFKLLQKILQKLQNQLQREQDILKQLQQQINKDTRKSIYYIMVKTKEIQNQNIEMHKQLIQMQNDQEKKMNILHDLSGQYCEENQAYILTQQYLELMAKSNNKYQIKDFNLIENHSIIFQQHTNLNNLVQQIKAIIQQKFQTQKDIFNLYFVSQQFEKMDYELLFVDIENLNFDFQQVNQMDKVKVNTTSQKILYSNYTNIFNAFCQTQFFNLQQACYFYLKRCLQQQKTSQSQNFQQIQQTFYQNFLYNLQKRKKFKFSLFDDLEFIIACRNFNIQKIEILINKNINFNAQDWLGNTAFIYACQNNNFYLTKLLLEKNVDIKITNRNQLTAIQIAQQLKHEQIVSYIQNKKKIKKKDMLNKRNLKLVQNQNYELYRLEKNVGNLVKYGIDIHKRNRKGSTAIKQTIFKRYFFLVKLLAKNGADLENKHEPQFNCLRSACYNSDYKMIKTLVKCGANITAVNPSSGNNLLHDFLYTRNIKLIQCLLDIGFSIESRNKKGNTPLLFVLIRTYYDVAEFLIDKGANINAKNKKNKNCFYYTCKYDNLNMAKKLYQMNVDIHQKDNKGRNSLDIACKRLSKYPTQIQYDLSIILYLIEIGVELNTNSDQVKTLHCTALYQNREDVLKKFHELNVDIIVEDNYQFRLKCLQNAIKNGYLNLVQKICEEQRNDEDFVEQYKETFYFSCVKKKFEIAEYLMQLGMNVNLNFRNQNTLLHIACKFNDLQLYEFLMRHNADCEAENKQEETPFMIACFNNSVDIAQRLLEKNINISKQDKFGKDVFTYACQNKNLQIIKFLYEDCKIDSQKLLTRQQFQGLFCICQIGDQEIAQYIMLKDINMEQQNDLNQNILMAVCFGGNLQILKIILENLQNKKIDISSLLLQQDKFEKNALQYAIIAKNFDLVDFLMQLDTNLAQELKKQKYQKFLDDKDQAHINKVFQTQQKIQAIAQ